jgi:hypothetical protein
LFARKRFQKVRRGVNLNAKGFSPRKFLKEYANIFRFPAHSISEPITARLFLGTPFKDGPKSKRVFEGSSNKGGQFFMGNEKKLWDIFAATGNPCVYRLYKAVNNAGMPTRRRLKEK